MKKSSCGFADVSLFLASSGGGFFWVFGAAVALPKGFDFGDSVCALKLHTLQTTTRVRTNDFIVWKNVWSELSNPG
jgi:hypothetical protein